VEGAVRDRSPNLLLADTKNARKEIVLLLPKKGGVARVEVDRLNPVRAPIRGRVAQIVAKMAVIAPIRLVNARQGTRKALGGTRKTMIARNDGAGIRTMREVIQETKTIMSEVIAEVYRIKKQAEPVYRPLNELIHSKIFGVRNPLVSIKESKRRSKPSSDKLYTVFVSC